MTLSPLMRVLGVVLVVGAVSACATGGAFRQGQDAALAGDWDTAVDYHRRAVQEDPMNPLYRIALERAMLSASTVHLARASSLEEQGNLVGATREYRQAGEFDPSNSYATGKASELERAIRDSIEASRPRAPIERMRERARQDGQPPLLDPASGEPLNLRFVDASLQDILDFIGNATGINVTYDQQFQDRAYSVQLDGVTIEEALDQILTANQYFYKVLNQRSLIVVPETPQKRAQYAEQVIRTFYISHAEVQELATMLSQIVRVPQMAVQPQIVPNITSNTITVRATTAVAGVIEQVIAANDKPRAEIVIDIEILEVNRERAREFGLDLSQYAIGALFSPEAAPPDQPTSPTGLSSPPPINLDTVTGLVTASDFYLSVPTAVMNFLETDSETRLIAKPQLRGQEGVMLTLNLGDDIPVPATAFTPIAVGGATVNPLTSFNYRPVGVIVEITPRVTYENEIILDLMVENSTLGPSINVAGQPLPTFGSRKVITRLRLRDGESNLMAGLLREEERRSLRGFPGLLHLPIIKQLFSANEDSIKLTDIVMLLTPRIVRTHELTQSDVSPIHIGTQRSIGLSGPPPLIAPQPEVGDAGVRGAGAVPGTGGEVSGAATAPAADVRAARAERVSDPVAALDPAALQPDPVFLPTGKELTFGPQIGVTPPSSDLRVGAGPYVVPISVSGVSQVSTLTLSLSYNPTVLRVSAVQEGSFMRQGGSHVIFAQQVDRAGGRVDLVLTRARDITGASGSGLLAAVVFEAVRPGVATLTPSGLGLTPGGAPLALGFDPATVTVR